MQLKKITEVTEIFSTFKRLFIPNNSPCPLCLIALFDLKIMP